MAVNESWVTGKKYRVMADPSTKKWNIFSFVSKAADTIFNDEKDAETKLGNINGITDSLSSTDSGIALSAKAGNELNKGLNGMILTSEGSGAETKYYVQHGSDIESKKQLGDPNLAVIAKTFQTSLGAGKKTVDFSDMPDYKSKTTADFRIYPASLGWSNNRGWYGGASTFSTSYEPSTGVLTITAPGMVSGPYDAGVSSSGQPVGCNFTGIAICWVEG